MVAAVAWSLSRVLPRPRTWLTVRVGTMSPRSKTNGTGSNLDGRGGRYKSTVKPHHPSSLWTSSALHSLVLLIQQLLLSPRCSAMGNNAGKGNVGAPDLLANFDDVELTRLDLRSKNIEHIPAEIAMLEKLTWLNLPNNLLTELPEHLCSLTALRTLRLLGNRLTHLPPSIGPHHVEN